MSFRRVSAVFRNENYVQDLPVPLSSPVRKGILYAHQESLPKLPVPSLEETRTIFLESIKPFGTKDEIENTTALLDSFINGIGKTLQERLQQRYSTNDSWLIEWWNLVAYMAYREPIVINVNYFFAFCDDKPLMKYPSLRAASIILAAIRFRDLVTSGNLLPDSTKDGPLCSEQYKYLFNTTRIPKIPHDITRIADPISNNHIIVVRKVFLSKLT